MSSKSALASLTATYTDSENEDDRESDEGDSPRSTTSVESQVGHGHPKLFNLFPSKKMNKKL